MRKPFWRMLTKRFGAMLFIFVCCCVITFQFVEFTVKNIDSNISALGIYPFRFIVFLVDTSGGPVIDYILLVVAFIAWNMLTYMFINNIFGYVTGESDKLKRFDSLRDYIIIVAESKLFNLKLGEHDRDTYRNIRL